MEHKDQTIERMLDTLEDAKEVHKERRERRCCENCETITAGTRLTARKDRWMELHYCAECDRVLTTSEYERWRAVRDG